MATHVFDRMLVSDRTRVVCIPDPIAATIMLDMSERMCKLSFICSLEGHRSAFQSFGSLAKIIANTFKKTIKCSI